MVFLGWLNVYAASYSPDAPANVFGLSFSELMQFNWFKQILWIGTAIVLIVVLVAG